MWQSLQIFYFDLQESICGRCWDPTGEKLYRLYKRGSTKLDKEMDLVKIIKALRNLKIFQKLQQDEKTKFEIRHQDKNLINIDTTEDESLSMEDYGNIMG